MIDLLLRSATPDHDVTIQAAACYDCGQHHGEVELVCSCGFRSHLGHDKGGAKFAKKRREHLLEMVRTFR